jgi:hypothetical protein
MIMLKLFTGPVIVALVLSIIMCIMGAIIAVIWACIFAYGDHL